MKRVSSLLLALLLIFSLAACNTGKKAGKSTPCTEEEIEKLIGSDELGFDELVCGYLITHQDMLPEDVLGCLNEHLGEYRLYKLSGEGGDDKQSEEELSEKDIKTIAAILQLHGYTPDMLLDNEALSPKELAAKTAENEKYTVDTKVYPTPEDNDRFLPFFQNGTAEVLAEAMGVSISAPREITFATFSEGAGTTVCAKITNDSNKTVQLIPANDLSSSEWESVVGYDPSLVINWGEEAATDIIPLSAATLLEPGQSTVQRYTYIGKTDEDFDFISRFSWQVTDGTKTELLAAAVLVHHYPSKAQYKSCTITGTVYNSATGTPIPFIDVQSSRNTNDYATTDINGRFTLTVPAFRSDDTGNWARTTVFVNEIGIGGNKPRVNSGYAEEAIIIEPHDGEEINLTLTLEPKPAQVNYTLTAEHTLGMQAYGFDTSADIIAVTPFHTSFSDTYKFENGYLHVFDKTGSLLFEKPIYGEDRTCDVSEDGSLIAAVVHTSAPNSGEPDRAVVWDINGNEVFSCKAPYKPNTALLIKPEAPRDGFFVKIHDVEISPDNKLIALQTDEGYVCVINLEKSSIVCDFYMKSANSHKLFFSADGKILYTASDCGDFRATELADGKVLWEKYIESMIMDYVMTDSFVITSTKATGTAYLICTELATGKTLWSLDVGMRASKMCLSHDGKTLFWGTDTAGTNERAIIIDTENGKPLWGPVAGKQAAAFSADDRYIAMRSGGDLTLRTITGEHLYGAIIAPDNNSLNWGLYMSGDCKYIVSFAGGRMDERFGGTMYTLKLNEETPLK